MVAIQPAPTESVEDRISRRAAELARCKPEVLLGYIAALLEHLDENYDAGTRAIVDRLYTLSN